MRTSTLAAAIVTGTALGTAIVAGSLLAAYHPAPTAGVPTWEDAVDRVVAQHQQAPTSAPTSPAHCRQEDGSGSPLPCRWDATTDGAGTGRSYWVLPAADGGMRYAYDPEATR